VQELAARTEELVAENARMAARLAAVEAAIAG